MEVIPVDTQTIKSAARRLAREIEARSRRVALRSGRAHAQVRQAARVIVALGRLTMKRSPKWARGVAVACLAIPGPVDELVVWPALVVYVAVRNWAEFKATARNAWRESSR